jgi:hypothetical protein
MTCPDRSDPHPAAPCEAHRPAGPAPVRLGIVLLGAVTLAIGCSDPAGGPGPALTRAEFIDVVVAIRRAELDLERSDEPGDSAAVLFQARRDSILAAHGTTPEELYEFLEQHSDLHYMDGVWDGITQGLKRPLRSRDLPPEPEGDSVWRQGRPPTRPGDVGRRPRPR